MAELKAKVHSIHS